MDTANVRAGMGVFNSGQPKMASFGSWSAVVVCNVCEMNMMRTPPHKYCVVTATNACAKYLKDKCGAEMVGYRQQFRSTQKKQPTTNNPKILSAESRWKTIVVIFSTLSMLSCLKCNAEVFRRYQRFIAILHGNVKLIWTVK